MIPLKIALTIGAIYVIICTIGCSEGFEYGWTWGITKDDGERGTGKLKWKAYEVRVDDVLTSVDGSEIIIPADPHKDCKHGHYVDPYTKIEYCLPENFRNINTLHLYRVTKIHDLIN